MTSPAPRLLTRFPLAWPWAGLLGVLLLPELTACTASGKAEAKVSSETQGDFRVVGDSAWDRVEDSPDTSPVPPEPEAASATKSSPKPPPPPTQGFALLGARHDLSPTPSAPLACRCLRGFAGQVNDAGFRWATKRPTIDPAAQVIVALSSEGVSCEDGAPPASYMGYVVEGEDIIIQIEEARPGRPVTRGAILPKPAGSGRILVSASKKLPYGKPLSGDGKCIISGGK